MPHGGEAIPALAGDRYELFGPTRLGLEQAGAVISEAHPDVIVIATPHGIRAEGRIALSYSERTEGTMTGPDGTSLVNNVRVQQDLAHELSQAAHARNIPTALLAYGASSGPHSCLPMDWGVQVPLWFCTPEQLTHEGPSLVTICPSRALPLTTLADFGSVLAEVMEARPERIAFIASSDLCHAHDANGPYGYDPAAKTLDAYITERVKADDLDALLHVDPDWVAHGKPDGLWQIAMLTGARRRVRWQARFLAYQVPTYFGMLTAIYTP